MPDDSRERRRQGDLEAALLLSEEFGLGELREIALARQYLAAIAGGFLALVTAIAGIPAIAGDPGWAKVINAAVFCPLFLLGCLLLVFGIARAPVTARLFWYSGGLAEFTRGEPEPRVLRWADVETVTIFYREGEEVSTVLNKCILRGSIGTEPIEVCGHPHATGYPSRVRRALTVEAARILAPRLAPPLIEAYESGEPVTIGTACVEQAGITVKLLPGDQRVAWTDIGSITTKHLMSFTDKAAPLQEIEIRERSAKAGRVIKLNGVPNGMLLPHLLARAAAQHGIPLQTSPRDLSVPWQEQGVSRR